MAEFRKIKIGKGIFSCLNAIFNALKCEGVPIFKNYAYNSKINRNNKPFRIPDGLTFISIDSQTGRPSSKKGAILEPFLKNSEKVLKNNIYVIDSIGLNVDFISGTGGLLEND